MSYQVRMADAVKAEDAVKLALEARGWTVSSFGQGQIPEHQRDALRIWRDSYSRPTLLRWIPDLLATRGDEQFLVDAKWDGGGTSNYAVECDAVSAGLVLSEHLHQPLIYVWLGPNNEVGCMTPSEVLSRHWDRCDGANAVGSGTPFYLVKKHYRRRFDDVFGKLET